MLDTTTAAVARPPTRFRRILQRAWDVLAMPLLAAVVIIMIVLWLFLKPLRGSRSAS